jgi:hypothetical protein
MVARWRAGTMRVVCRTVGMISHGRVAPAPTGRVRTHQMPAPARAPDVAAIGRTQRRPTAGLACWIVSTQQPGPAQPNSQADVEPTGSCAYLFGGDRGDALPQRGPERNDAAGHRAGQSRGWAEVLRAKRSARYRLPAVSASDVSAWMRLATQRVTVYEFHVLGGERRDDGVRPLHDLASATAHNTLVNCGVGRHPPWPWSPDGDVRVGWARR